MRATMPAARISEGGPSRPRLSRLADGRPTRWWAMPHAKPQPSTRRASMPSDTDGPKLGNFSMPTPTPQSYRQLQAIPLLLKAWLRRC